MGKSIKLNTNLGGHKAGDTITVTTGVATYLTDNGYTEQPKPTTKAPAKPADK